MHWSVQIAGSGITYAVLTAVPNIGIAYVVDSYRPLAREAMTSMTAFKNTFAFGISFGLVNMTDLSRYAIKLMPHYIYAQLAADGANMSCLPLAGFRIHCSDRRRHFLDGYTVVHLWRANSKLHEPLYSVKNLER